MKTLIEKIVSDSGVREAVTQQSFLWFFHIYFAHYVTHSTASFHKEIFDVAQQADIPLSVILAFRGSGKSSIISMAYPLWAMLGSQQKKFVLLVGRTQQQAYQHLKNIKAEIETNEVLMHDYGQVLQTNELGQKALTFPKIKARIQAVSMEQSIRGIRHLATRPDLIICDDIEDLASVRFREQRDKTYNWLTGEILPAGDINTKVVIIGNLLHDDSLVRRFEKKIELGEMSGLVRRYPFLTDVGEALWAGKFPDDESIQAHKQKVGNHIAWEREYLLNLVPDDYQLVQADWFKSYRFWDDYGDLTRSNDATFKISIGVDLAISQRDTADYTTIVPVLAVWRPVDGSRVKRRDYYIGSDRTLDVYVLPQVINKRMTFLETKEKIKEIVDWCERYLDKTPTVQVESVGYQQSMIEVLEEDGIKVEGMKTHGQDKRARLASVSHLIENGQVWLPSDGSNIEELIEQVVGLGKESHDDLADALVYALKGIGKKPVRFMYAII